jgi:hypothetical protein
MAREGLCISCGKEPAEGSRCGKCKERAAEQARRRRTRINAYQRARNERLRLECIAAYGGRCVCCGEDHPRLLTIDHVNDDGAYERKSIRSLPVLIAKLKREGWPRDRYQIMCFNCNCGRAHNGGVCPHKEV